MFLFSLTRKIKLCLEELPRGSITNWNELQKQFLDQFFLDSKMLKLKDEISYFRKFHSKALYDTWLRVKKKLMLVPNHKFQGGTHLIYFLKLECKYQIC